MQLEDPDAARPLLELIGRSRDARARQPLIEALDGVRTRADVTAALGALGDRAAVPTLARLLVEDPYVNVRVAAARGLGTLGGDKARAALLVAQGKEREQPVQSAISAALAPARR
jgi:HEAT repeat protein